MTLDVTTKLERIDKLVPYLMADIKKALYVRVVMESANNILLTEPGTLRADAGPINVIQQSLTLGLALDLSRIFDFDRNRKREAQQKASIPVLIALLSDVKVQAALRLRARDWVPFLADENDSAVDEAIGAAIMLFGELENGSGLHPLARLKELRNLKLAHSLFHKEPEQIPFYADLFVLADAARDIGQHVMLAVEGGNLDLKLSEELFTSVALEFWRNALQPHRRGKLSV
jgi:hypothetical protein